MHFLIVHSKLYFVVLISSWAFKPWFQFILQCVELLCSFGKFWSLMHMKTKGENLSNLGQTKFFLVHAITAQENLRSAGYVKMVFNFLYIWHHWICFCACFSLKTKTPGRSWLNNLKFASRYSEIEVHGMIHLSFFSLLSLKFILYESLYHGWWYGWFVFFINYVDQLQYSDESATVPVVIALRTSFVLEFAPLNTKGRQ